MTSSKLLVGAFLCLSSVLSLAATDLTGTYKVDKEVIVMSDSEGACSEANGRWEVDQEVCTLETTDDVVISQSGNNYKIHINIMADNYYSCEFDGTAKLENNVLVSKVKTEDYDIKTAELKEVVCEVKTQMVNGKMNVTNNKKCRSFCGANANLEVSSLKKIK